MLKSKNLLLIGFTLLLIQTSFAGDEKIGRCGMKFFNALNRLEVRRPPDHLLYFQAPKNADEVPKSALTKRIQNIEKAQLAIVQKRRVLAFYKSYMGSSAQMRHLRTLEQHKFVIRDDQGRDVEYRVKKLESMINEVVDFDTEGLNLEAQAAALRNSSLFKASEEKNHSSLLLPPNHQAVADARKLAQGQELIAVAKETKVSERYGLFAVTPTGTEKKPEFVVSLNSKSSTGLIPAKKVNQENEYSVEIQDVSSSARPRAKELEQLSGQVTTRFQLPETK